MPFFAFVTTSRSNVRHMTALTATTFEVAIEQAQAAMADHENAVSVELFTDDRQVAVFRPMRRTFQPVVTLRGGDPDPSPTVP